MRTGRNARTKLLRAHARARTHTHTHTTYAYDAQVMRRCQEFRPPARDRTLRGTVCLDLAFNIERVGVGGWVSEFAWARELYVLFQVCAYV